MKTVDELKCESILETDEKPGGIIGSALVDSRQKKDWVYSGVTLNGDQLPFKAFNNDCVSLRENSGWGYVPEAFKTLVDNANDGICIVYEDMRHAYVNRKYCEITGYSDSELKKISMVELISDEDRETFKKNYRIPFYDETKRINNCIAKAIRKDGIIYFIECSRSKIIWQGKPAIQAIIRDVTDNLKKEKMIKERNRYLSSQIEKVAEELILSLDKLKQKKYELVYHKTELENVNKELLQTNRAMSILARNIDKKMREVEQRIAHTVLTKIIPIIHDFKKKKVMQKYSAELEVLNSYVKGLTCDSDQYNKVVVNLSASEMRIASLIKNGMSSQSIADTLNISLETVKTHRKKIRRKLDIINSDVNLTSYLQSVMSDTSQNGSRHG